MNFLEATPLFAFTLLQIFWKTKEESTLLSSILLLSLKRYVAGHVPLQIHQEMYIAPTDGGDFL